MGSTTDWIKELVGAPLEKLVLIVGSIFFLLAFNPISYDEHWVFKLNTWPNWWLLFVGITLIGIALYSFVKPSVWRIRHVERINNGFRIKLDADHIINIVLGEIEAVGCNKSHVVVVLPANTSFDDDCIRDPRSALGAFVQKHFPSGITEMQRLIQDEAKKTLPNDMSGVDNYPVGSNIFLEKPLGSNYRIMITAITQFSQQQGFVADTESLVKCLKGIFKTSAGQRLSEIYMPVIGSGHGGLDFNMAISLILLVSIWYMKQKGGKHIKQLTVVVLDKKDKKSRQIKKIVQAVGTVM